MLIIGQEIGIPGELVSNSSNWRGKTIRYRVDAYNNDLEEYELSNGVSVVFLPKDVVEEECKIQGWIENVYK